MIAKNPALPSCEDGAQTLADDAQMHVALFLLHSLAWLPLFRAKIQK